MYLFELLEAKFTAFRDGDYNSSIGRFLSEDPLGVVPGYNTFLYVLNNPKLRNDPFGLQSPSQQDLLFQQIQDEIRNAKQGAPVGSVAEYEFFEFKVKEAERLRKKLETLKKLFNLDCNPNFQSCEKKMEDFALLEGDIDSWLESLKDEKDRIRDSECIK
ncbi:MAG: hypothetical protein NXH75_05825 [Halobacteriovoraceae bacterium]|nr:hypothetical protein [Halobacteriovoraceae bacterium]